MYSPYFSDNSYSASGIVFALGKTRKWPIIGSAGGPGGSGSLRRRLKEIWTTRVRVNSPRLPRVE